MVVMAKSKTSLQGLKAHIIAWFSLIDIYENVPDQGHDLETSERANQILKTSRKVQNCNQSSRRIQSLFLIQTPCLSLQEPVAIKNKP